MMRLAGLGLVAVFLVMLLVSGSQSGALGLAVGMLFGALAGMPAALLVMATGRRRAADAWEEDEFSPPAAPPAAPPAPPAQVTVNNHYHVHLHGVQPDQVRSLTTRRNA